MQVRALRWRFAAVALLLLAACARWPLAGVPMADASPPPISGNAPRDDASAPGVAGNDPIDGPRTLQSVRAPRKAALTSVSGRTPDGRDAIDNAREDSPAQADAGLIGQGAQDVQDATRAVTESAATAPSVGSPQAGAAARRVASGVAQAALVAGPDAERAAFKESHQRAGRWLAGIAAALVLLFIVGRRKRHPRRVRKMNTHRSEPVGALVPPASSTTKATGDARVRMFSAREMYAPTHETHHGPWEAPVKTERGFAHCYEVGAEAGEEFLFVPESVADGVDAPHASRPQIEDVETAGLPVAAEIPVVTQPIPAPALPLVFATAAAPRAEATTLGAPLDEQAAPVATRMQDPQASAVQSEAATIIDADIAMQSDIGVAQASPAQVATASLPPVATKPDAPSPKATTTPTGTGLFDASELFRDTPRAAAQLPDPAPRPAQTRAQAQVPAAPLSAPTRDPIAEARRLVQAGDHAAALRHLDEAMRIPHPSEDVWRLAALCWWQIGRADGGSKAYANAADAMERLLERDPSQTDLWYRAGSCRLQQAADERGATRRATLDQAVTALRHVVPEDGRGDPLQAATLGDALFERALAATDEALPARAQRMAQAVQVLRQAARGARDPASLPAWRLQQALQTQASFLSGTEASRLRLEADAVLAAGADRAAEQERVVWIAAKAENELAHAELAEGATRILHLRAFRENHRDLMTGPDAAPELMLGWLELLALETGHLRGDAARSRFDEGEAILKRLDDMLPGNTHVALARARLLHRRALQSGAGSRHAVLSDAIAGLMALVERGDVPQARIEVAELLLDRAAGAPKAQAAEDHARAEAMASGLLDDHQFAMAAARCVLQARLGQSSGAIEPAICRRLEAQADEDVRARWLLARAALRNGTPREACGHCEIAARSGARLDQAFIQLWDKASRQWSATLRDPKDPAWLANKQRLRSAS